MLHSYRSLRAITAVAALYLLSAQAGAQAQKRIALVIGNGEFAAASSLAQPANDAKRLGATLEAAGFSVTTLIDADAAAMSKAGRAFLDAAPAAELRLFYFSGYAVQAGGSNWLIPARSEASQSWSAKAEAFSADSMLSSLAAAGSGANVFILDASRDGPFSQRAGSKGVAKMSAENSIVAFSAAPGSTAEDGADGGAFTNAIVASLPSPGKSLQEILYAAAELAGAASKAKQAPWISTSLTRLYYLNSPQEAFQSVLASKAEAESAVKQLDARVNDLRARSAIEKDASQRMVYDAEMKAQSDLLDAKKRELEAIKGEQQRQVSTNEAIADETAKLAEMNAAQAEDEKELGDIAELRRWEIGAMVDRAESADDYLTAIETAASAQTDIGSRLVASLTAFRMTVDGAYEKRIRAVSSWTKYPWESDDAFRARASAERIRLSCGRQALGNALAAEAAAKTKAMLDPFAAAGERALDGLERARGSVSREDVKITVGDYDRDAATYPITIESRSPDLPFSTTFSYSIANDDPDKQKDAYKVFEAWRGANAFSAEIDSSISYVDGVGYAAIVDAYRLKVADASGERLLIEESPISPIAFFKTSADRENPTRVSSWLSAVGYGTELSVNGGPAKKDRLFLLGPKAGDYVVRASFNNGAFDERLVEIPAGGHALVEFRLGSFSIPWLAAGSTVTVRRAASVLGGERAKGAVDAAKASDASAASDDFSRIFTIDKESAFRSPLLPEGSYKVSIAGQYPYETGVKLSPGVEAELPGYVASLTTTMSTNRDSLKKKLESKKSRTKIGIVALGVGATGAVGAVATYFLGADASNDLRTAHGTPQAVDAHNRLDIYSVAFPIAAVIGAVGLGLSPALILPGQKPSALQSSIDSLDGQIKALAK
jgi:uncharacterized caspase-like protein